MVPGEWREKRRGASWIAASLTGADRWAPPSARKASAHAGHHHPPENRDRPSTNKRRCGGPLTPWHGPRGGPAESRASLDDAQRLLTCSGRRPSHENTAIAGYAHPGGLKAKGPRSPRGGSKHPFAAEQLRPRSARSARPSGQKADRPPVRGSEPPLCSPVRRAVVAIVRQQSRQPVQLRSA